MQTASVVVLNSPFDFFSFSPSLTSKKVMYQDTRGGGTRGVLEDPPFEFPSAWQWGQPDLLRNLCVQNAEQGATLIKITHVDVYRCLHAGCSSPHQKTDSLGHMFKCSEEAFKLSW